MVRWGVTLLLLAACNTLPLFGCKDRSTQELSELADQLCKCETLECATAILDRVATASARIEQSYATNVQGNRMLACYAQLQERINARQPDAADGAGSGSGGATGSE